MRRIEPNYFDELLHRNNTVPRDKKTGDVLSFVVGKEYTITDGLRKARVKCTQNCPTNLLLLQQL